MSQVSCEEVVRQQLDFLGTRFSCRVHAGSVWVVSPYTYPDGDLVEVTVRELGQAETVVTDLGETLRHLATHGFDPRATSRGEYLLAEILKQHDVGIDRGMILKRSLISDTGKALQEVLTACVAVSHLLFLSRGYRPATFVEEVGHLVADRGLAFESHHYEVGLVTHKRYSIDVYIPSRVRDGLIQALSPASRAGSIPMVNATFRLWSDVPNGRWRATVLDDRVVQWRREDVVLLEQVSDVYEWTSRERLDKALGELAG